MYLLVGLGNPGREYEHTRHNMGFDVVDMFADSLLYKFWIFIRFQLIRWSLFMMTWILQSVT